VWATSQWSYDGLNRVRSETARDNAVTTFAYDAMGIQTNGTMPGSYMSATFSAAGRHDRVGQQRFAESTRGLTNTITEGAMPGWGS